jgi:hypothetical protein
MKKILIRGLAAGILMLVASLAIGYAAAAVFPSLNVEYEESGLFRPMNDPWMSYMFIHPLLNGLFLSWLWDKTKGSFKGKDPLKRGMNFGLIIWIVFNIPGMLITISSFPLSELMVASWAVSVLIQYVLAGIVFSKMDK